MGGTKAYMAPAQALAYVSRVCGGGGGETQAGASVLEAGHDPWAFGLVVAELAGVGFTELERQVVRRY